MFFRQILSNTKKNRKDNGLFFATLIIAIVAFYTLLSLESQDVMRFLNTIESDAVRKLMLLVPLIYVVSLFFVFFLVYFAYRYQMENRRKEFGLYLMLGMKRSRLFLMLICETVLNSILSILAGIPIALLLTESISLATARLVGLGIIGHQFTVSLNAVLGTIGGFFLVQLAAMLILSFRFCRMEPAALLRPETETVQKTVSGKRGFFVFFCGVICLIAAYIMGIFLLNTFRFTLTLLILICGIVGTFMLYRGLGAFIGQIIQKHKAKKTRLYTFTGRQIQESVLHQHTSLAVSSLLLLLALAGGGAALWQISDIMAEGTRCGQVFASVTPQDGVLEFTLMGQSGSLPYAAWGHALWEDLTALPAAGRLLLWSGGAVRQLWQTCALPFLRQYFTFTLAFGGCFRYNNTVQPPV